MQRAPPNPTKWEWKWSFVLRQFSAKRLLDRKHVFCYAAQAFLTFSAAVVFVQLFKFPYSSLNQLRYDCEHAEKPEDFVQHHNLTVRIFWFYTGQFAFSVSLLLLAYGLRKRWIFSSKGAEILTISMFLLLTVLAITTFLISTKHETLLASKLISKEINHLLQDASKFALNRLQINNTCCGTILSGSQPKRRSVNCPFSFQVPNCVEMFEDAIADQRNTVSRVLYLLHPISLLLFLYSNFANCRPFKKNTAIEEEQNLIESEASAQVVTTPMPENGEEITTETETYQNNFSRESGLAQSEATGAADISCDTEINLEGNRTTEILSRTSIKEKFSSHDSGLFTQPRPKQRLLEFHSEPINYDKKEQ